MTDEEKLEIIEKILAAREQVLARVKELRDRILSRCRTDAPGQ